MEVKTLSSLTNSLVKPEDLEDTGATSVVDRMQAVIDSDLSDSPSVADCKQFLNRVSETLDHCFDESLPIRDILNGRATAIDELLIRLWNNTLKDEASEAALIAVGGYGRAELHPYSDIDLLILTAKTRKLSNSQKDAIEAFITALWDLGLDIGHSVRDIKACKSMAKEDVTVMTNLIESRLITGSDAFYDDLREMIQSRGLWPSTEFFKAKYKEQQEQHEKFLKASYALEPNIKKSPGSMRDIQLVGWVTKRHFGVNSLNELLAERFLTEHEYLTLQSCENYLWRLRFALHQVAGRGEDRLLFDHQKPVAEKMCYSNSEHLYDVEHLMQDYFKVVRTTRELNDMLLQHFSETILYANEKFSVKPIDENFQVLGSRIEAKSEDLFLKQPVQLIKLFYHIACDEEILGVRAPTIRAIINSRTEIDFEAFHNDPEAKRLFLDILRHPNGMVRAFVYMRRYGVLRTYLPAYARIVGQMQYDLFHIYTVDEHTLFVMQNIDSFSRDESKTDFALANQVMKLIPNRELLLLVALFHDNGKGQGGDHSEIGAIVARKFCQDHGLNKQQTDMVVWLVADHLVMSMTAQRKDITDPKVIHEFASRVGTVECLNYIYLLTVADICATSHTLWNNWKDTLLSDLYKLTRSALQRGLDNPQNFTETIRKAKAEAVDFLGRKGVKAHAINALWENFKDDYFVRNPVKRIAWQTHQILKNPASENVVAVYRDKRTLTTELFVYMPKHEEYFTQITSFIHKKNLSIHDASLHSTRDGFIMGSFVVLESDGQSIRDNDRVESLKNLLSKKVEDNELQEDTEGLQKPNHRYQHFDIETEISFQVTENLRRTLVEITTLDRPGLLSEIGKAFLKSGVELHSAKVVTLGEKVEDVFSVTNMDGSLLTGQQELGLKMALLDCLDEGK